MKRLLTIPLVMVVAILAWAPSAWAAPSNDLISSATKITALPFLASESTTGAHADGPRCGTTRESVFFKFRPSTTTNVLADTLGSNYATILSVWRGPLNGLVRVACASQTFFDENAAAVHFTAQAGKRYIFEVASFGGGHTLHFSLQTAPTEAPTVTANFSSGTADVVSGVASLTGSFDCNHRMEVVLDGTLREVVNSIYTAHAFFELVVVCPTAGTTPWTVDVDPEGDIAFVPGNAKVYFFDAALDGIDAFFSTDRSSAPVTLS
jgi:hypothetical protein